MRERIRPLAVGTADLGHGSDEHRAGPKLWDMYRLQSIYVGNPQVWPEALFLYLISLVEF